MEQCVTPSPAVGLMQKSLWYQAREENGQMDAEDVMWWVETHCEC